MLTFRLPAARLYSNLVFLQAYLFRRRRFCGTAAHALLLFHAPVLLCTGPDARGEIRRQGHFRRVLLRERIVLEGCKLDTTSLWHSSSKHLEAEPWQGKCEDGIWDVWRRGGTGWLMMQFSCVGSRERESVLRVNHRAAKGKGRFR